MLLSRMKWLQRHSYMISYSNTYIFAKHISIISSHLLNNNNISCIYNTNTYRYIHSNNKKKDDDEFDRLLKNLKYSGETKQCAIYIDQQLAKNNITIYEIATIMQKSSKYKLRLSDTQIDSISFLVNKELKPIKMIPLCQMFHSLNAYDDNNNRILSLMKILTLKLNNLQNSVSAQGIGNILYGLQNMSSNNEGVQGILQAMIPHIKSCKDMFTSQGIGNALYGLQNMNSNNVEVQGILQAMQPHI